MHQPLVALRLTMAALACLTAACPGDDDAGTNTGTLAGTGAGVTAGTAASAGMFAAAGTGAGTGATAGAGASAGVGAAGSGVAGAAGTGTAGTTAADGGTTDGDVDAGPLELFEALRQTCVAEINTYRATLSLPPLARAPADDEACSDDGAELDHTAGAHASAAANAIACRTYGVAQNTCQGRSYDGSFESAADQLKHCLKQMWDEGEPAEGVDACVQKYFDGDTACFLAHGHYINMISTDSAQVSCGFHDNGGNLWMNQDFE